MPFCELSFSDSRSPACGRFGWLFGACARGYYESRLTATGRAIRPSGGPIWQVEVRLLFPGLGEAEFEEHQRFVAGNDFGVRDIEHGWGCECNVAGEIEEKKSANGGSRGNDLAIERKRRKYFLYLGGLFISARERKTRHARRLWPGRALGMRDQVGGIGGAERINILLPSILKMDFELNRLQIHSNGMVRFVAQKNFHREDSYFHRIRFTKFFFRASAIGIGIGQDGHTFVSVVGDGWPGRTVRSMLRGRRLRGGNARAQ